MVGNRRGLFLKSVVFLKGTFSLYVEEVEIVDENEEEAVKEDKEHEYSEFRK